MKKRVLLPMITLLTMITSVRVFAVIPDTFTYEPGSVLTHDDFILYEEDEEPGLRQYNSNVLDSLEGTYGPGQGMTLIYTSDKVLGDKDYGEIFTYRGLNIGNSTYDDMIEAYGIGLEYNYDVNTDPLRASYAAKNNYIIAEQFDHIVKAVGYFYANQAQIMFFIDDQDIVQLSLYSAFTETYEIPKSTIQMIQGYLKEHNYDLGEPDGIKGPRTTAAIQLYREKHGLLVNSAIDDELLKTIYAEAEAEKKQKELSARVNQIKAVQEALNQAGYDCGTVDGVMGDATRKAIRQYEEDNGLEVTGDISDVFLEKLEVDGNAAYTGIPSNGEDTVVPLGIDLNEDNWESQGTCDLMSFLDNGDRAGFSFYIPSGQQQYHKVGTFLFIDNNTSRALENVEFYYCVVDQIIGYTGLSTDNEGVFKSPDFREACIRLLVGYNIHYENGNPVSNVTKERAEEIVDYILNNNVEHCIADNLRIRCIRDNDTNEPYFSFHLEY